MRRWDLVSVVLNGVIGAGIFGLPSKVYGLAGDYSLLAFGICALCVAIIVLNFCEVASRYSGSGGPYLYARETYGPAVGFAVGWLLWIARITSRFHHHWSRNSSGGSESHRCAPRRGHKQRSGDREATPAGGLHCRRPLLSRSIALHFCSLARLPGVFPVGFASRLRLHGL